jgi:hypothetical protein
MRFMIFYELSNKAKAFENIAFVGLCIFLTNKVYKKIDVAIFVIVGKQIIRPEVFLSLQIWSTRENYRILSLNEV